MRLLEAAVAAHNGLVNDLARGHAARILEQQNSLPRNAQTLEALATGHEFVRTSAQVTAVLMEIGALAAAGLLLRRSEKLQALTLGIGTAAIVDELRTTVVHGVSGFTDFWSRSYSPDDLGTSNSKLKNVKPSRLAERWFE